MLTLLVKLLNCFALKTLCFKIKKNENITSKGGKRQNFRKWARLKRVVNQAGTDKSNSN